MTNHILRCRLTAHHVVDRPYDGTTKDFARVLAEHEATVAALRATGASIILEDARPMTVRKVPTAVVAPAAVTEPLVPDDTASLDLPAFLKREK